MTKCKNSKAKETPLQIGLPNLGPVLPGIDNAEYVEMAKLLDDLLVEEFNNSDQHQEAPFIGTMDPADSDLLQVPTLIALLANLPVVNPIKERLILIPLVRAMIPTLGFDIPNVLAGDREEDELPMIDALFSAAVLNDSKAGMEIADRVLYRMAVVNDHPEQLPRLVDRFYEIYLADCSERHSLHHCVFEYAHARLKLLRLKNGAPAGYVLSAPLNNANRNGPALADELLTLANESSQTFLQKVQLWITFKKQAIAEFWPSIVADWNEEDATASRSERSRNIMPQYNELKGVLVDLRRLHKHQTTVNSANSIDDSEPMQFAGVSKSQTEELIDLVNSQDVVARNMAEDDEELDENCAQQEDQAPSVIVFPKLDKTGNRDLDERLRVLREKFSEQPLPLIGTPDLTPIRSSLVAMLPHLETVIDRILNGMVPHQSINIPPILLVGAPGCGKTTLAQELAGSLTLPSVTFDAAGVSDANFMGVDMRWSTGSPGLHLDLITTHKIANPLIIMDEIEKLGGSTRNGDARKVLMGLLEPRSAAAFYDPFLNKPINLSELNWMFTANKVEGIPAPLQNRLEIIRCPSPTRAHLDQLAPQLLAAEYRSRGLGPEWSHPLTADELAMLRRHWQGGSIRNLKRLINAVIDAREKFMARA